MKAYFVTDIDAFSEQCVREFSLETQQGKVDFFIIKSEHEFHAYHNKCPHLGIPLNWQPDDFLSIDEEHIQCSTHGALFTPNDGHCIVGPCSGQSLDKLNLEQRETSELWVVI